MKVKELLRDYCCNHPVVYDNPSNRYNYGELTEQEIEDGYGEYECDVDTIKNANEDAVEVIQVNFDEPQIITKIASFTCEDGDECFIGFWEW